MSTMECVEVATFTFARWQIRLCLLLAYGWRAGNLNWLIRIQQAGKTLLSWRQCKLTGKALKSGNFSHWRWHSKFKKGDLQFPKPHRIVKSEKIWNILCLQAFNLAPKIVVRRVSPCRIKVVLFWTKCAVRHHIKPGNL